MLNVSGHNIGLGKNTSVTIIKLECTTLVIRKNVETLWGRLDVRKSAQTLDREDSPLAIFVPCIALPTRNPRREKETK